MTDQGKSFLHLKEKNNLLPLEEKLATKPSGKQLTIGIPKEKNTNERRIPLAPMAIDLLRNNGHRILVEKGAGVEAGFSDSSYSESGAEIVNTAAEAFKADIIIKIAPPLIEEINLFGKNKVVFSSLSPLIKTKEYFQELAERKITAIAYEFIKDKTGAFPLLRSMSEIIGNASIMIAAEYLSRTDFGKGVMLGGFPGIRPSLVVILGAGTVAEFAARTALGMGAEIRIFDDSIYKMRALQNKLGTRIFTSIMQPSLLYKSMINADVVIGAKHSSTGDPACMVSSETIKNMKKGAVIVDVSIDQGGCFETSRPTSHKHPVYKQFDVTHYCVPNIASRIPHTASYSISNYLSPLMIKYGEGGSLESVVTSDKGFGNGVYMYNGILTKEQIGKKFNLSFRDLDLLLAAFL